MSLEAKSWRPLRNFLSTREAKATRSYRSIRLRLFRRLAKLHFRISAKTPHRRWRRFKSTMLSQPNIDEIVEKALTASIFRQIDEVTRLSADWDGYGTPAPSPRSDRGRHCCA